MIKNLNIYPKSRAEHNRLVDEYLSLGYYISETDEKIIVHTRPPGGKPKKPKRLSYAQRKALQEVEEDD